MNTEIATLPARSPTSAAERMRRHRQRRRKGVRIVRIQLRATEIDALIRKGYLDQKSRDDLDALEFGVDAFVDDALTTEA